MSDKNKLQAMQSQLDEQQRMILDLKVQGEKRDREAADREFWHKVDMLKLQWKVFVNDYRQQEQMHLQQEQLKALIYLVDQVAAAQMSMWFVQRAITLASTDLDLIFADEGNYKGVDAVDLAVFIGLVVFPELAGLGVAVRELVQVGDKVAKTIRQSKAAIAGAKSAGKGYELGQKVSDSDSGQAANVLGTKYQVLANMYDHNLRNLVAVSKLQSQLVPLIFYGSAAAPGMIQLQFKNNGLERKPQNADDLIKQSNKLGKSIVYEVVRRYAQKHVTVEWDPVFPAAMADGWRRNRPKSRESIRGLKDGVSGGGYDLDGLSDHQEQMIYDRFATVPWNNPKRPPIKDWKDIFLHWNVRID